jgi:hypothetical protein
MPNYTKTANVPGKDTKKGRLIHNKVFDDDQTVYINAFPLIGKNVVVQSTHKQVMDTIEYIGSDACRNCHKARFRDVYTKCLEFDTTMLQELESGNKERLEEFQDFCFGILVAYCYRMILHDKPIPMSVELPEHAVHLK